MIYSLCRSWMFRVGCLGLAMVAAFSVEAQGQTSSASVDGFTPDINGVVNVIVRQSDGKLVVGGAFTQVKATSPSPVERKNLARFNRDGSVDTSFAAGVNGTVKTLVLQSDGKIVVGGTFDSRIARFNADGSVDTTFSTTLGGNEITGINALAVQANGKILIGATAKPPIPVTSSPTFRLLRLNADGSVDTSFKTEVKAANSGDGSAVNAIAVQADGKILVGGAFTAVTPGGAATAVGRNRLLRLNSDGSLDASYDPSVNNSITAIAIQADGSALIAGAFSQVQSAGGGVGYTRIRLARLKTNGEVDANYAPTVNATINTIALQADGRALIGGSFSGVTPTSLDGAITRFYVARLNFDGTLDTGFDPAANAPVNAIVVESDGRIILGGNFTQVRFGAVFGGAAANRMVRLAADGSADVPFLSDLAGRIIVSAVQPDGKIVVGGTFVSIGGFTHFRLARLNADGSLDNTFVPTVDGTVQALAAQPDGKILLGGTFNTVNGTARNYLVRLNSDGTLDTDFDPAVSGGGVQAIAVQSDAKIVIGGSFTTLQPHGDTEGTIRPYIARLNGDGSLDKDFDPEANGPVNAIQMQSDGKIVIGGGFTTLQPNLQTFYARYYFARLNSDGTVDSNFIPHANGQVNAIAVQPDGKVIVAGVFTGLQPLGATDITVRNRIARVNNDGSLDTSFDPNANGIINTVALQSDGKILVGGLFTLFQPNGAAEPTGRNFAARLNADGTVDTTWDVQTNYRVGDQVTSITLQSDGKALLAGDFFSLTAGGLTTSQIHLARINADGTVDATFGLGAADRTAVQINALVTGISSRVVAAGSFTNLNGATSPNLARFNYDGTPDYGFAPSPNGPVNAVAIVPGITSPTGAVSWLDAAGKPLASAPASALISGEVKASVLTSSGKILLGGLFTRADGNTGANLAMVTATGTLDSSFLPDVNGAVNAIALQSDGRIIIGGAFTAVAGTARNYLARLNADGTLDTGFSPNANGIVTAIGVLPDGKILVGGEFTSFQANGASTATNRSYLARLSSDGSVDTDFTLDLNARVSAITVQSDGKPLVGGRFTTVTPPGTTTAVDRLRLIRLKTDGTIDADFNPAPDDEVVAIAVQADGKIMIGGAFTRLYFDSGAPISCNHLARLESDGKNDASFGAATNSSVHAIQLASDGSILAGGAFTSVFPPGAVAATARSHIARFASTGALDTEFAPSFNGSVNTITITNDGTLVIGGGFSAIEAAESILAGGAFTTMAGNAATYLALINGDGSVVPGFQPKPNGAVQAIARQPDGELLVGGAFTQIAGENRSYLARLAADGTLDGGFNANLNGSVVAIAPQSDGQVLLAGAFTSVAAVPRNYLARVSDTGALDTGFAPAPNSLVDALVVQADGKIVVGGRFTVIGGGFRNYIARLNPNGTLDTSFNADTNGFVTGITLQTDGHLIVTGSFTQFDGVATGSLVRLNADGTLDSSFTSTTDGEVTALALEVDGRAVIGGKFSRVDGQPRFNIARVTLGGVASQSVSISSDLTTITWSRSGSSPEISGAQFETSADGQSWKVAGTADRVGTTSDWQLGGLALSSSTNVFVRARGITLTGANTSSGLVESAEQFYTGQRPGITSPTTVSATSGRTFFYAIAASNTPTSYAATGLPAGLTIDPLTGVISGQPTQAGTFAVTLSATNVYGTTNTTLTLIINTASGSTTARLVNLSARAGITATGGPSINGFVITGSSARSVLIRGIGPGLAPLGVQTTLSQPSLTIFDAQGHTIASAQAWGGNSALSALFAQLGAFPLDAASTDAAAVVTLPPGVYTVHLSAGNGSDGVGLGEIYDSAAVSGDATRLVNLSSRGKIGTGENVMIAGFVIQGTGTRRVLVRAAGPALTSLGVNAAATDPLLTLQNSSAAELARNDNWGTPVTVDAGYPAASASDVATAASTAGAFALATGSKDAAIIVTLPAGAYTAQASGVGGTTGEALLEVYELPDLP